jgi:hypothetical protein
MLNCIRGGLGTIAYSEFREDARNVIPHSAFAQEQDLCNFTIGLAF